jgi:hypothetical protein
MKKLFNILAGVALLILAAIVTSMISVEAGVTGAFAIAVYTKACEKNVAGNSAVYLVEAANIDTITVTSGEVSAVTMDSGKTFMKVGADLDGIKRTEVGAGNASNIAYTHRVEMFFAKPSTALNVLRDALSAASPCGILAIVTDANGNSWLVGYNATDLANRPLRLVQDEIDSGNSPTDEDTQRAVISLEGVNGSAALPFDSTLKAAIAGGSATFISYV